MTPLAINELLAHLPGEELIRPGLTDFHNRAITIPSLLVAIASNRLRAAGILECTDAEITPDAELKLYALCCAQPGDAYSQYNAHLRRLIKFEHALDRRLRRGPA